MASGPVTQVSDVVVPRIFTPYTQQLTEVKSRLVQAGVLARNSLMDTLLGGGGRTFDLPSFRDLDDDVENVASDDPADIQAASFQSGTPTDANRRDATPKKIQTSTEIAVRLERNQHWSSADLASDLAGADPMEAISNRVAAYWTRRLQSAFVATMNGVIADNTSNDSGDYTYSIAGGGFVDGVTNFSAEAFLDAALTMGDSMEDLVVAMMHSVVYNRAQKNNLIDFIPDARGEVMIPTFLGREVVVDDGMPRNGNVYDTWLFGRGALQLGVSSPKVPTEIHRQPLAGQGGGQEVLSSRVTWSIHPVGHAYVGSGAPNGGPANTTGTAPLNAAASWDRVFPQRKQIKFARLVTREA